MAEEHDEMNGADEALRVLREELRVEPSPQLAAAVRERVSGQHIAPRATPWILPAAAALVLAAGGALLLLRREPGPVGPAAEVALSTKPPADVVGSRPSVPTPDVEPARTIIRPAHRAAIRPEIRPVQAIVPAGEEARIARYAASLRRRPFDAEALPALDPSEPLPDPAPIDVALLDTTPLVPDEGSLQ